MIYGNKMLALQNFNNLVAPALLSAGVLPITLRNVAARTQIGCNFKTFTIRSGNQNGAWPSLEEQLGYYGFNLAQCSPESGHVCQAYTAVQGTGPLLSLCMVPAICLVEAFKFYRNNGQLQERTNRREGTTFWFLSFQQVFDFIRPRWNLSMRDHVWLEPSSDPGLYRMGHIA